MKKLITLLFILVNLNVSTTVKAEGYVTLGVNCDALILFEYFQEMDPLESEFIKRVTSGDCRGTHYEFVPRWYAEIFVDADPVDAFFIEGENSYYDGGTLDPITLVAEPGDNPFSIPWYWYNTDNIDVPPQLPNSSQTPYCSPDITNNYQEFTEIS